MDSESERELRDPRLEEVEYWPTYAVQRFVVPAGEKKTGAAEIYQESMEELREGVILTCWIRV